MNAPFRLGTCLFTLVDVYPGHERAYDEWYERDHFYAGMMAGPHVFAGRRFVVPRRLRALPGSLGRGSFLTLYWIEAGRHEEFLGWAAGALERLTAAGRMFEHRDHVHTSFYELASHASVAVPPELALDHPFAGTVAMLGGDAPSGVPLRLTWTPVPTPGFEPVDQHLHAVFLDRDPEDAWDDLAPAIETAQWAVASVPTVPGTGRHLEGL